MLQKDYTINWLEKYNRVFLKLKHKMISASILKIVDSTLLYQVEVDLSGKILKSVLLQTYMDNKWYIIAFKSKLSSRET